MPGKPKPTDPKIVPKPTMTMAVVTTVGDPNTICEDAFSALYGSVYGLKMQLKKSGQTDFKVTGLRARWPDAHLVPKEQWTAHWALPIPDGTSEVPQKVPSLEVRVEKWDYGTVAEILHIGPYTEEGPSVARLHEFIVSSGYEIAGQHEEEYLTSPKAKVQKTIIRYQVRQSPSK